MHALGEFKNVQAVFKTHGKSIPLFDETGKVVNPAFKVTAPEYILVQGVLESGAAASINLRCVPASVEESSIRWIVSGTEGELELIAPGGSYVQGNLSKSKLLVKKWKGETEEIDFNKRDEPAYVSSAGDLSINIARLYESFATGKEDGYPSFESAKKIHNLIEQIKKVAVWAP